MLNKLHPAWNVCIGLALVIFVLIATGTKVLLMQQNAIESVQDQQKDAETRAYIARALSGCADIINDAEMEITTQCTDPRVAAYYPPSICEKLLALEIPNCGSEVTVVMEVGG